MLPTENYLTEKRQIVYGHCVLHILKNKQKLQIAFIFILYDEREYHKNAQNFLDSLI
jgi:hypothetical protein